MAGSHRSRERKQQAARPRCKAARLAEAGQLDLRRPATRSCIAGVDEERAADLDPRIGPVSVRRRKGLSAVLQVRLEQRHARRRQPQVARLPCGLAQAMSAGRHVSGAR